MPSCEGSDRLAGSIWFAKGQFPPRGAMLEKPSRQGGGMGPLLQRRKVGLRVSSTPAGIPISAAINIASPTSQRCSHVRASNCPW